MNFSKNNWDQETYSKAWNFATIKHSGQKYGGSEPEQYIDYLNHIGTVTMEVLWFLNNTSTKYNANLAIQCAILHDTLEDTETTFEEIQTTFGLDVAKGVLALTKNNSLAKSEQMLDSLSRIKKENKEVWLVKLADRISNLSAPPFYWDLEKIKNYREEAKIIFTHLHEADGLMSSRLLQKIEDYLEKYIKTKE